MAVYNSGNNVYTYFDTVEENECALLYGEGVLALSAGVLTAKIPPHSLVIFTETGEEKRGFMKDNILYRKPVSGSTLHCEDDVFLGIYASYNGKSELTGLYVNGDIVEDGEEMFRFFRWENMQPK